MGAQDERQGPQPDGEIAGAVMPDQLVAGGRVDGGADIGGGYGEEGADDGDEEEPAIDDGRRFGCVVRRRGPGDQDGCAQPEAFEKVEQGGAQGVGERNGGDGLRAVGGDEG